MSIPRAESPSLAGLPGIRHGFFGRQGGVSTGVFSSLNMSAGSGDDSNLVVRNRAEAVAALGFPPATLATIRQIHSNRAVVVAAGDEAQVEADAMVTNRRGIVLGILTADCVPILLADPAAGVIGAAHAGWKGAADGVVGAAVAAMVELGARPAGIVAAIGPAISRENYEVGPQFAAELLARHPNAANRISSPPGGGREHFDLPGFVADQLRLAGLSQIDDLGICTYAGADTYFSHRRATHEGSITGRQITLIGRL